MKIVITIILFCLPLLSLISEEISLFDCIDAALINSYELQSAEQNVKISASEKLDKLYSFFPDISAYSNAKRDIDGNEIGTNNLSVSENLYLFDERFSNYTLSNLDYKKEKLNYEEQKQTIVLEILQLYADILILKKSWDYYQNSSEFYQNEIEFIEEMMKSGKKTELDLFSTQIELKNSELNISQTQNEIEKKLMELSYKTGKNLHRKMNFPDISNLIPAEIEDNSFEKSFEWKISGLSKKSRKIEKNIYLKRIFPDLYLNGYYNWRNVKYWKDANQTYDYEGNFIIRDQETKYWEVSLNLSYSLGSFAQKLNDYAISKRRLKQQEFEQKSLEETLQTELAGKKLDLKLKQDEIDICNEKLTLSEKKLTLSQEKFRLGLISFLDFKTAFNETLNARLELLQVKYDLIIAYAEWQKIKGEKIFGKY